MSVFNRSEEQRCLEELRLQDEEVIGSLCRLSDRAVSPGNHMEQEKRIRREIANSNERRRMQSINAGFQSLRTLLPHHEGEKLSKAAILQQTAEYIYQLEQEKTNLLQQNCHLKRLVNQCEAQHEPLSSTGPTAKKRKLETTSNVITAPLLVRNVFEMPDEGIGSVSPEPLVINTGAAPPDPDPSREMIELRVQLDRERRLRMQLQDQVRSLEHELYPGKIREITQQVQMQYHQQEVVEQECASLIQETAAAVAQLQVVSASALPPVAQTTTIVATSPIPSPSPPAQQDQRLPSVLEAAIKAEPKVEVERLPSPVSEEGTPQAAARLYLASRSRQNLETIVEAIRHLEGDHLFGDEPPRQEAPLALTKKDEPTQQQVAHRLLKVEMNPFLQFHGMPVVAAAQRSALQQQRPGVIVVKQQT